MPRLLDLLSDGRIDQILTMDIVFNRQHLNLRIARLRDCQ
jgi:hypothetical protein